MRQDYVQASNRHFKNDYPKPLSSPRMQQAARLHHQNQGMDPGPRAEAGTKKDLAAHARANHYQGTGYDHGTLTLGDKDNSLSTLKIASTSNTSIACAS